MTVLEAVKKSNHINHEEFEEISQIIFQSIALNGSVKSSSYISKKEALLTSFSDFIAQYLKLNFTGSKQNKLTLIKIISKLNLQKELFELASGETKIQDFHKASQSLGKKSQSAFVEK
ncbi:hypothetical protein [Pedobacter duraquae]|uniref:Uncharacterized protein n=1 Tax=Pedobacter duraquae TaxID=425511 RepID=A0A4V3C317_9SPHI|nr:hypothetical protein [Pedobacter duraquae]TDO20299.1 hypothetical protein CLV32_4059 [Pedobacter duraquae]